MKTSQLLRDKLGLSQENMAQYLKITLSQLAMYETGKRDLPTNALLLLAEMELFFEKNQNKQLLFLVTQEKKVQEIVAAHTKVLEYKLLKEERLLEKIQKKYDQSIQLHLFTQHLQNNKVTQNTMMRQLATMAEENNSLGLLTHQIIKLEGIKSLLKAVENLKKM